MNKCIINWVREYKVEKDKIIIDSRFIERVFGGLELGKRKRSFGLGVILKSGNIGKENF